MNAQTATADRAPASAAQRRPKVLVLGEGVSAFLAVVRSLGRQGIDVHVGWCRADCASLRSRYIKKIHRLPFCDSQGTWVGKLASVLESERYDLVIATNEQSTRALYAHRGEFERFARLALMDERAFNVIFDKVKCGELAASLGLLVPKSQLVTDEAEVANLETTFHYPIVLKPTSSYDAQSPLARRHVVKAYNSAELRSHAGRMLADGPVLAQENFMGQGVGVELLVDHGQILLAFQHQRVHQPPGGGASSYRKSVPLDADLLAASRKLVEALDYSGVVMVEFLVNPATRDWRFVEANGRFWGSLPLAIAAGADFPYCLYRLRVHGDRNFPQTYKVGLYCRDVIGDLLWFVKNLRADRSDPTLSTVPPWKVLGEIGHLLTGRERFDNFALDDPLPALAEPFRYARKLFGRIGLRVGHTWASLPGVRQWESQQARRQLSQTRSVVFLCWGNICRSPFAAAYARRVWPAHMQITSSGLHHDQGRISPSEATQAAADYDITLGEHRSTLLSPTDVDQADLIVCFDEIIYQEFCARFPQARRKAVRFGSLGSGGSVAVADPFGLSLAAFSEAYARIAGTLDASCDVFDHAESHDATMVRTGKPSSP